MVFANGPVPQAANPDALLVVVWVSLGCGILLLVQAIVLVARVRRRQDAGGSKLGIASLIMGLAALALTWRVFADFRELHAATLRPDAPSLNDGLWGGPIYDQVVQAVSQSTILMLVAIGVTLALLAAGILTVVVD